ncbi:MAG: hypothetical protein TR69_WS6001001352 [candidate division WS6 bacterium OLB20]|uniref:Uncharacterized protein n=1 Tax=candidate division WS6 bacterium OLB20 TaxID=1617426 RepID=A0A136LWN6_9BACT|nr:MAG: hypothetical protein TR69_WS6001001352 [candidate division WS6 bacterium OLB20]
MLSPETVSDNNLFARLHSDMQAYVNTSHSISIDGIIHTSFDTGRSLVKAHGQPVFTAGWTVQPFAGGRSIASQTHMVPVTIDTGGNDDPADFEQGYLARKTHIPGIIAAGRCFFLPWELKRALPSADRPDVLGISLLESYYGSSPEAEHSLMLSLVMQEIGMKGRRIVEFGSGAGAKLTEAAVLGATELLGFELPGTLSRPAERFAQDLSGNNALPYKAALIEMDVRDRRLTSPGGLQQPWRTHIRTGTLPDTAFISLGPSYNPDDNMDNSPTISALETVLAERSIETVILTGYATEYRRSYMQLPAEHYEECDQLTREMLNEGFEQIDICQWGKLQVLVGRNRRKPSRKSRHQRADVVRINPVP